MLSLGKHITTAVAILFAIGIDARDEALKLAKDSGANVVIDARIGNEKVVEEVNKVTNGQGADAAITLSDAPSAAGLACAVTKMHGLMVQIAQVSRQIITRSDFVKLRKLH